MPTEPKKQHYDWNTYHQLVQKLQKLIVLKPEIIVSIGKGGSIPGVILAEHYNIKNLNLGLASYSNYEQSEILEYQSIDPSLYRDHKILVVDDLADSGKTFQYVLKKFKQHFCDHVQTASVFFKSNSNYKPDYFAEQVDHEKWIVQPWEA